MKNNFILYILIYADFNSMHYEYRTHYGRTQVNVIIYIVLIGTQNYVNFLYEM